MRLESRGVCGSEEERERERDRERERETERERERASRGKVEREAPREQDAVTKGFGVYRNQRRAKI